MTIQNIVTSVLENVKEQTDKKQDVLPDGVKGQILVKKSADETEWKDPGEVPDVYTQAEQRMLGAYNLLRNDYQSQTISGVTITRNADGTLEFNGTATGTEFIRIASITEDYYNKYFYNKTLKLTGCPANFRGNNKGELFIEDTATSRIGTDYGKGDVITFPSWGDRCYIQIKIYNGATFNHDIFKPMITTDLNATYDDYVPYAMSNYDLTYRQPEVVTGYTVDSNYILNAIQTRFNVTRIGKLVIININCEFAATAVGWLNYVTGLPRPVNTAYASLFSASGKLNKILIDINGNLGKCADASTEGLWYSGQIVYFTID